MTFRCHLRRDGRLADEPTLIKEGVVGSSPKGYLGTKLTFKCSGRGSCGLTGGCKVPFYEYERTSLSTKLTFKEVLRLGHLRIHRGR
jgi:hypothetical protein